MIVTTRETLIEEFLKPKGICISKFAIETGLTLEEVDIMSKKTAKLIADYTKTSVAFWRGLPLTSKSYEKALLKLQIILNAPPGVKDFKHANRLIDLIERYEKQYHGEN